MLARKSIKQKIVSVRPMEGLMESFRLMCNEAIRIGLSTDASSLKRLSKLTYGELKQYDVPSCYKLCAISKAAGILASRKKSKKRGFTKKSPHLSKPLIVSCYGFKIEDASLLVPVGNRSFERISLNHMRLLRYRSQA